MDIEDENDDNDDDDKNEPKTKRGKHLKYLRPGFGEHSKTASKMLAEVEAEHMTPKKVRQVVTSEKIENNCSLSLESCILLGLLN